MIVVTELNDLERTDMSLRGLEEHVKFGFAITLEAFKFSE